jgi:hypothetical protein
MKWIFHTMASTIFLAACGDSLEGTYADKTGYAQYKFETNGKVNAKALGQSIDLKYEIDGDSLMILEPAGDAEIFALNDDGSISGPEGFKLIKID